MEKQGPYCRGSPPINLESLANDGTDQETDGFFQVEVSLAASRTVFPVETRLAVAANRHAAVIHSPLHMVNWAAGSCRLPLRLVIDSGADDNPKQLAKFVLITIDLPLLDDASGT